MTTVKRELETPTAAEELHKRKGSKPGRKPLDTEAKNKRTAQNRAAQRAFRERKERKMRELEEQVERLERVREQSELESEFLRSQLQKLLAEIQKYRPRQSSDSQVLNFLAKAEERRKSSQEAAAAAAAAATTAATTTGDSASRHSSDSLSNSRSRSTSITAQDGTGVPSHLRGSSNSSPADPDEAAKINANVQRKMNFTFAYAKDPTTSTGNANHSSTSGSAAFPSPSGSVSTSSSHNRPFSLSSNTPRTSSGSLDFLGYNSNNNQSLPKFVPSEPAKTEFDFNSHFDEQVSEFCTRMNEVCGTRECPVAPALPPSTAMAHTTPSSAQPQPDSLTRRPSQELSEKHLQNQLSPQAASSVWDTPQFGHSGFGSDLEDPTNRWMFAGFNAATEGGVIRTTSATADSLPFIDTSMAFPTDPQEDLLAPNPDDVLDQFFEEDPIVSQLTTEESAYDQFKSPPYAPYDMSKTSASASSNDSANSSADSNASTALTDPNYTTYKPGAPTPATSTAMAATTFLSEDAVVPARDGTLLKCSEVWDRITSHPKYSDIDIDGLCLELRTKAKCSEKGVVVNIDDVQRALTKHMS